MHPRGTDEDTGARRHQASYVMPGAVHISDPTEREAAAEALRRSEARYRILFDGAADAIFVHDAEGRILAANAVAVERYGYSQSEFLTMTVGMVDTVDEAAHVPGRIARVLTGQTLHFETEHRRRDGTSFPVDVSAKRVEWDGRPATVSICRDITDRRRAEAALAEGEIRLRLALDALITGVWSMDCRTGTVAADATTAGMLGCKPEELATSDAWVERLHPDDRPGVAGAWDALKTLQVGVFETERRYRTASGDWRWVLARARVTQRDDAGEPVHVIGVHADIDRRKRAEEEHARLEAQLQQARRMESLGVLAGGVAHVVNNSLTAILGYAEMALETDGLPSEAGLGIGRIEQAGRRAAAVVRQLLTYSRLRVLPPQALDLNQVVAAALESIRRSLRPELRLAWAPASDLWTVSADAERVGQVLASLCTNAQEAITGATGTIAVSTRNVVLSQEFCATHPGAPQGEYVVLTVVDDGCGMDEATLARLYEPFFTTKDPAVSLGLGLAAVHGIVEQSGGYVDAWSKGVGSTFEVYLPRHQEG